MSVRLRSMGSGDVEEVVDLEHAGAVIAFAAIFDQGRHPFPRDAVRGRWTTEIDDPEVECLVVEADGEVAGFVALRGDELLHFGTAPGTWGSGLASAALREAERTMSVGGVPRAWLWVMEDNVRARRFYARCGWARVEGRARSAFAPHPVLLRYERDLPWAPAQEHVRA